MKKLNGFLILTLMSCSPFLVSGQTDVDALRYSQTGLAGTARFMSMGGAFGALGGDFSALSWNPAGIAIYRSSEFTFTPSLYFSKTKSDFIQNTGVANKYNFNIGDLGLIITRKLSANETSSGWKNWNFGVGYNRLNNFHFKTLYEGVNYNNSLLDYFLENVNSGSGTPAENLDPFYESLAYETYLINPDSINSNYYNSVIPAGGELQRRSSTTKGAMSEIVISFGANYSNKLYLGGTVGFNTVRYVENTVYEETDKYNSIFDFKNFRLSQNLTTVGYGVNLKLGLIYRINDWVRLGAAFHTPSFYSMKDDYNNSMSSTFDNGDAYSFNSPAGVYEYNLTTPMRAIGSVAFVIGKIGLISADYEFVDYSEPTFDAPGNSFFDVNNLIQNKYEPAGNLKIGTEWRYENYSFRGGYAMYGSPFTSPYRISGADMSKQCYSLGIGIREKEYFIDFAYVLTQSSGFFQPYYLSDPQLYQWKFVPGAVVDASSNNISITLGVKF